MRISLAILALLAGCAAPQGEAPDVRSGWNGASYDEVVSQWGTPVWSGKLADGRDAHTWRSETWDRRIGTYPSTGTGMGSGPVGGGTEAIFASSGGDRTLCERTLIFKDGRVAEQTWNGSAQYCSSFARGAAAPKP